jgi:hypothetical protein
MTTADELVQPGAQKLLTEAPLLRLAYNGLDGTPRVIPIGFVWTRERIVICTATTSPKARALSERPQVALTIDIGSTPMNSEALLIRGEAQLETVDGVPEEYIAGARKVLKPEEVAAFQAACEKMYERMVRITISPEWARYFDFGAGRLPGFLQELAAAAQKK